MEEGVQSVSKNLGNQLIVEISETNRPKLIDSRRVIYFGNEGYVGMINFSQHMAPSKK